MYPSPVKRTWWTRPANPPPFRLQPRDIKIVEAVFKHRFIRPVHIHALLGGSEVNLNRRMRLLWQHRYLERPRALRPLKALTEEIVYALGKKGAQLLEHQNPDLRIGHLDWTETPKKQIGWPYIDHQLGVTTFFIAMQVACDRAQIGFHWDGHFNRKKYKLNPPGMKACLPDGYFTLEVPGLGIAHHFLELDRGNVSLERMTERYLGYFTWWKDKVTRARSNGASWHSSFKHFRVLTVTHDREYVNALRRAATKIGKDSRHPNAWKALMFTHLHAFDLDHPNTILASIFNYADDPTPVSLIPRDRRTS